MGDKKMVVQKRVGVQVEQTPFSRGACTNSNPDIKFLFIFQYKVFLEVMAKA